MRGPRTAGGVLVAVAVLALAPGAGRAAAAPTDTDVRTCIDGGGFPDFSLDPAGGVLSPKIKKVCQGGKYNGQPLTT
ncbi:hypothetical protein [Streptomyces sp. NPDC046261]|uniref:hypothetical protein n=1 Tax=Streptomyces sp. NPDC046261 TaxID=3157200 RepID=UPI0033C13709